MRNDLYLYRYRCKITRVIDGDTVDVTIDVGFRVTMQQRLRLLGINAPETKGETKQAGDAATEYLKELLQMAVDEKGYHYIATEKDDAFGRYLAVIYMRGNTLETVNQRMIDDDHAVEFRR